MLQFLLGWLWLALSPSLFLFLHLADDTNRGHRLEGMMDSIVNSRIEFEPSIAGFAQIALFHQLVRGTCEL